MPDNPWLRIIDCKDAGDRDRSVRVSITDTGMIVLTAPPPGNAYLDVGGCDLLKAAISSAQREVDRPAWTRHGRWEFPVKDLRGVERMMSFAAINGFIRVSCPTTWTVEAPDARDIGEAWSLACDAIDWQRRGPGLS